MNRRETVSMKQHITCVALLATVTLMGALCVEGSNADQKSRELLEAKGNAYVRLRDAAIANQQGASGVLATATPEERLLREVVSARKTHPQAFGHYADLVEEDRRQHEGLSASDLHIVRNSASRFAPLAHAITRAVKRQSSDDERRRVALAVEEHFWKLAESEYEQYNTLVAMVDLAQVGLLDPAILNEVVRVTQNTGSPRVAEAGLRLIHLQNRSVNPDIVNAVWQKHKSSAQVDKLCRALLNEQEDNAAAIEILRAIDEDRNLQDEEATTKQHMPGKKVLSADDANLGHVVPLEE